MAWWSFRKKKKSLIEVERICLTFSHSTRPPPPLPSKKRTAFLKIKIWEIFKNSPKPSQLKGWQMEIRNLSSHFFWLFKEGYRSQRFPPPGESHDSWVQPWQYAWGLHLVWWIAKKNLNKEKASRFIMEGKCHVPPSFTKMFSVWGCMCVLSVPKAFLVMYSVLFINCIHILSELEIYYPVSIFSPPSLEVIWVKFDQPCHPVIKNPFNLDTYIKQYSALLPTSAFEQMDYILSR